MTAGTTKRGVYLECFTAADLLEPSLEGSKFLSNVFVEVMIHICLDIMLAVFVGHWYILTAGYQRYSRDLAQVFVRDLKLSHKNIVHIAFRPC
jgi:hypothetical protein